MLLFRYQGHLLAKELVAKDLQTTVITDSAVFAMISRVNMVSSFVCLESAYRKSCFKLVVI